MVKSRLFVDWVSSIIRPRACRPLARRLGYAATDSVLLLPRRLLWLRRDAFFGYAATTHGAPSDPASAGCLPMIAHDAMVPNYFQLSFFPWRRILHVMTQIRYKSDHMWVGAARLGIQDAMSYPESHGYFCHCHIDKVPWIDPSNSKPIHQSLCCPALYQPSLQLNPQAGRWHQIHGRDDTTRTTGLGRNPTLVTTDPNGNDSL